MDKFKKMLLSTVALSIIIFLTALFFRVIFLDRIPTGITNDELNFILNAKSILFTGKDISGVWSPLSLEPVAGDFPQSELTSFIMSPFVGILPLSLGSSKLPYAVASSLFSVLLFFITLKLIGKKQALITGIVFALNPWGIFFGRTAYEAPLAIFFYLLGFHLLLVLKGKNILFALIPFVLGFYTYMGTKFIFLPLIGISLFYAWYEINKRKFTKTYILFFSISLFVFLFFLTSLSSSSTKTRLSELSTPMDSSVSVTVDQERRLSIKSPISNVFSNKPVVWGKQLIDKYFTVFSPEFLFLRGEGRSTFSLWFHGYFYYIDAIFLFLGMLYLYIKKRRVFFLLLGILIISPIPTLASNVGAGFAALRSSLLFPTLCIFIGCGIYALVAQFKNIKASLFTGILMFLLYLILILNFVNIYFLRYPVYSSEAYSLSNRILSKYLELSQDKGIDVTVIVSGPKSYFLHYLFDTNSYNFNNTQKIKKIITNYPYNYMALTFMKCSPDFTPDPSGTIVVKEDEKCPGIVKKDKAVSIPMLEDGGTIFTIINDKVCYKYKLKRYPHSLTFSNFDLQNISEEEFCKSFITRPALEKATE